MPRLKTKDPPELVALRTEIAAGMAYLNINRTELARKSGINYNTLSLRFSDLGEHEDVGTVGDQTGIQTRGISQ